LKNILGTDILPAGTLQSGAEGIKMGIYILIVKQLERLKRQNWQIAKTKDCHRFNPAKERQVTKHTIFILAPSAPIFGKVTEKKPNTTSPVIAM
jgi:hypothetical protein